MPPYRCISRLTPLRIDALNALVRQPARFAYVGRWMLKRDWGDLDVDQSRLFYDGNSQGGIMGGARSVPRCAGRRWRPAGIPT
jgi:hypothetical protein